MPAAVTCNETERGRVVAAVMIGVDLHKGSHTAVAIGAAEEPLGQVRVRASEAQAEHLLAWAGSWPQRTWAVEGAAGLGHLLAQQLVAAGERVLDVQPKLGARVRLLASGDTNKNDPNDARSVAIAALRSGACRPVRPDDHATVLKLWAKRHRDLGRTRTQVVCRLHAVLCELVPGGVSKRITAAHAARVLEQVTASGAVAQARWDLAADFLDDLRRIDTQMREVRKRLTAAVRASGTTPLPLSFRSCVPFREIRLCDVDGVGDFFGVPGSSFGGGPAGCPLASGPVAGQGDDRGVRLASGASALAGGARSAGSRCRRRRGRGRGRGRR